MKHLVFSLSSSFIWISSVLVLFSSLYLFLLLRKKEQNYKKLKGELGYLHPEVKDKLFAHIDDISSRENELKWHQQLGKVFGFYYCDMPQLKVADLNIINEIFLKQNKLFNARTWYEFRMGPVLSSILFNKGHKWKKSRKILQPAIAEYRIKKNESVKKITDIQSGIDKLVQHFKLLTQPQNSNNMEQEEKKITSEEHKDTNQENNVKESYSARAVEIDNSHYSRFGYLPVVCSESPTGLALDLNAYEVMQVITLDVIFRIGFNKETVDVIKGSSDKSLIAVRSLLKATESFLYKIAIAIPFTRPLITLYIILFDKNRKNYKKFMNSLIGFKPPAPEGISELMRDSIQEDGTKRIYHVLMDEYRARKLAWKHVVSNSFALIVAGFETTATTSAYVLWCIAKHQECKEKLKNDLQNYGVESKYLDMFLKEVMRMYPALPNFVIRTPSEDTTVAGYTIKKGMSVYMSVNTVHYDESVWKDPYRFDPERFGEGNTYPPGAYAPFGLGHRMCAGYQLALREMKTIVCELLTHFDIQLVAPTEMNLVSSTIFLTKPKHDIRLRLIPLPEKIRAPSTSEGNPNEMLLN